jgi:drug/metabolite transporter (DMT)-like permease
MKNNTLGFLFASGAALFYGFMPAITQLAYGAGAAVNTVVAGKYTIGVLMIWGFILVTKKPWRVSRAQAVHLQITGITSIVTVNLMAISYLYLPGAICSLLTFLYVPIVNVCEMIMGRVRLTAMRIVCVVLALVGLVAVVYTPSGGSALNPLGLVIGAGAGVAYAVWTIRMGSPKVKSVGAEAMMGYIFLIPAGVTIIRCIVEGDALLPAGGRQWLFILLLGVCDGFLAPVFFAAAIKLTSASNASMVDTSEPLIAYFAGIVLMHDIISINAIFGGLLIIAGILLLNISERRGAKNSQ